MSVPLGRRELRDIIARIAPHLLSSLRRMSLEEQRRVVAQTKVQHDKIERERMTALGKRPTDLRPRLKKAHAGIV